MKMESIQMKSQLKFNLLALGFDFKSISNSQNFTFDILEKPSKKIFEIVIHFIICKIKPSLSTKRLIPNCSDKEIGDRFRKAIEGTLTNLRDEFSDFLIPRFSKTLLKSPKGPPVIELLFQLSILALFQSLGGYKDSSILVPVKLDSDLVVEQLHTYKLAALSTYNNLCFDIKENKKNQNKIKKFLEEQLDKKNQLLVRKLKLEERYERSVERREDKVLLSGNQIEELKGIVQNYWNQVIGAVGSTKNKFGIFQRALDVYKSKRVLDGEKLVPKIPLILKEKFEVELYKEIGDKFLENGFVDLIKLPLLCNYALKMMKNIIEETNFSSLSSKSNNLEEDLKQGSYEVDLLTKILKDLKDQLEDYEENSEVLKQKLDHIYSESYKQLEMKSINNLSKSFDLLLIDDPIDEDVVKDEYFESESFKESLKEIVVAPDQRKLLEYLKASEKVEAADTFMFKDSDLSEDESEPSKTDLSKTDLSKTDPCKTDSSTTDLSKTDLSKTDLSKTDLSKTDSSKTDPSKTDLCKTDLSKTDLAKTDLCKTDLSDEDLSDEDLSNEDLSDEDLDELKLPKDDLESSFKGCRHPDNSSERSSSISLNDLSSKDDLSSSSRDKDRKDAAMNKLADMIVESTLNDDVTDDSWLLGDVEGLYDEEAFKTKNKIERTPEQKSCSSKIMDPLIFESFDQKIDLPEVGSLLDDEDYTFMEEVSLSSPEEVNKDVESCDDAPLIFFDSPPSTSLASEDQDKVSFENWKKCQKKIKSKKVSRISWYNIVPDSWHDKQ